VFNNSAKGKATKYLVIPTWRQIITDPAAVTAIQTVNWISATNDRAYIKYDVPAVPEPMTMAMFGLGGLALVLRRKMKKSA
jgi:hypothetical protein